MPATLRSVVVLPAPFDPTMLTISPGATAERDIVQHFEIAVLRAEARHLERSARHQTASSGRAEIRFDHARIGANFGRRAFGDFLPVVEHDDAMRDAHDEPHHVFDPGDRRDAALRQREDELGHRVHFRRREPGHDLVEQQHRGFSASARATLSRLRCVSVSVPALRPASAPSPTNETISRAASRAPRSDSSCNERADRDVVDHAEPAERAHDLIRAADAEPRDAVRRPPVQNVTVERDLAVLAAAAIR